MDILGFDTETYHGYVKVLTSSIGRYIESDNAIELLDFLFETSGQASYNVFYNIGYDLGSIVKKFVLENGDDLHNQFYAKIQARLLGRDNREDDSGYSFFIGNYKIVYLTDKMFSLRKGKMTKYFWDASNFYKHGYGHMSLGNASELYLGKQKIDKELDIDRAKIGSELGYYEAHRDDVIKYSIRDCVLTAQLFERSIIGFQKIGFIFPRRPYSEASIFKEYLKNKWDEEIEWSKMYLESERFNYFRSAYRGGIFRTLEVGHFENVYDIDLNSAYPSNLSQLYSIVNSQLMENEKGDYTFYHIRAIPNDFLPLKINNRLVYASSNQKYEWYITEWDKMILDMYHYPYEIIKFIGIKTDKKRLLPEIEEWYTKKSEIKNQYGNNSVEYYNIKILLNAGYGIFAQSYPNYSKYTNFIYAAYTSARTRYHIALAVKNMNHDKLLSISTDGIMFQDTSNSLDVDYFNFNMYGEELGKWKIEYYDSVTQYANGIYLLKNKDKHIIKKRGFEQLQLNDFYKNTPEITFHSYKPMKIISAIIQRKYADLNDFTLQEKTFSPYLSWLNTNPKFAEQIHELNISDFHASQLHVNPFILDDYADLYEKVSEKQW